MSHSSIFWAGCALCLISTGCLTQDDEQETGGPPAVVEADHLPDVASVDLGSPASYTFKVRTRDCFSSSQATALRNRAVADGFDGSFRFLRPKR